MLRYKRLLLETLDPTADPPMTLRGLARAMGIPIPSMHSYVHDDVLPRIDNIQKMADYFGESMSSLFSHDDDTTTALVAAVRRLTPEEQARMLQELTRGR